jgi:enoyl-CoA hydratase/carnithine racemase
MASRSSDGEVRVERRADCAWVTLDRPPLNLLTPELIGELRRVFEALAREPDVRAAVVSGAGRMLTGGMQLQVLRGLDQRTARPFIGELCAMIAAVHEAPFPTVAMINGACLGAGFEMALACDLRVASTTARLGLPEVRVGIPSVIHAALLPPLVGPGRAAEVLLTGEPVGAEQALAWGLVNRVAPPEELVAETERLLASVLAGGVGAIRLQKELIVRWRQVDLRTAIKLGIEAFARAYTTDEPQAAMEAFFARRRAEKAEARPPS